MPRKIRELKEQLRRAGFIQRSGRGSHSVWRHPRLNGVVVISGGEGDDAKPYQERDVRRVLRQLEDER